MTPPPTIAPLRLILALAPLMLSAAFARAQSDGALPLDPGLAARGSGVLAAGSLPIDLERTQPMSGWIQVAPAAERAARRGHTGRSVHVTARLKVPGAFYTVEMERAQPAQEPRSRAFRGLATVVRNGVVLARHAPARVAPVAGESIRGLRLEFCTEDEVPIGSKPCYMSAFWPDRESAPPLEPRTSSPHAPPKPAVGAALAVVSALWWFAARELAARG